MYLFGILAAGLAFMILLVVGITSLIRRRWYKKTMLASIVFFLVGVGALTFQFYFEKYYLYNEARLTEVLKKRVFPFCDGIKPGMVLNYAGLDHLVKGRDFEIHYEAHGREAKDLLDVAGLTYDEKYAKVYLIGDSEYLDDIATTEHPDKVASICMLVTVSGKVAAIQKYSTYAEYGKEPIPIFFIGLDQRGIDVASYAGLNDAYDAARRAQAEFSKVFEKYISLTFKNVRRSDKDNSSLVFSVSTKNVGTQTIKKIYTRLTMYSLDGKTLMDKDFNIVDESLQSQSVWIFDRGVSSLDADVEEVINKFASKAYKVKFEPALIEFSDGSILRSMSNK